MIEHVYNAASKSKKADEVIVATDDERIYNAVLSFNGRVEMTSSTHQSGTDRLVEVAHKVQSDIYVNVQGDEPEINVSAIDELIDILESSNAPMATLLYPISSEEADNPNIVKQCGIIKIMHCIFHALRFHIIVITKIILNIWGILECMLIAVNFYFNIRN